MPEWYDEVKRIYNFHISKIKEHGKVVNKGRSGKEGWSISDTATALACSKGKVSEAIRLYKFAQKEGNEEVKKLPERRAAITLMKYREM